MKLFGKILMGILGLVFLIVGFIQFAPLKTYDTPYPDVTVSTDSLVLARGEYLVFGPAHCVDCHSAPADIEAKKKGEIIPLIGGNSFETPLGEIFIPNLTPDNETGIGKWTNGEIARALRFGVKHNNNVMIPVMRFTHMSESDVSAIISYLRSTEPIVNKVPKTEYTFIGKVLTRFLLKPLKATEPIPKTVIPDTTIQYGKYLVQSVGNCNGCHSKYDITKMQFVEPSLTGGDPMDEGGEFVFYPPNLTPDPETGHIYSWSEEAFVTRFKAGEIIKGSPMPWPMYKRMSETETRAIYRYLKTLEPVNNNTEPTFRLKEN